MGVPAAPGGTAAQVREVGPGWRAGKRNLVEQPDDPTSLLSLQVDTVVPVFTGTLQKDKKHIYKHDRCSSLLTIESAFGAGPEWWPEWRWAGRGLPDLSLTVRFISGNKVVSLGKGCREAVSRGRPHRLASKSRSSGASRSIGAWSSVVSGPPGLTGAARAWWDAGQRAEVVLALWQVSTAGNKQERVLPSVVPQLGPHLRQPLLDVAAGVAGRTIDEEGEVHAGEQ